MPHILDSETLDILTAGSGNALEDVIEVSDVDVKRLRDDQSEILSGDEVAFVAVAKFRITDLGLKKLDVLAQGVDLAAGDDLFYIDRDAELRSEKLQIAQDDVILWIYKNYRFEFSLNGSASPAFQPVGRVRVQPSQKHATSQALPWLTKLNTVAVKDDYVDVDVRIGTSPSPVPPPVVVPTAFHSSVDAAENVALRIDGQYTPEDVGKRFVLMVPQEGGGRSLKLTATLERSSSPPPDAEKDIRKSVARTPKS